MRLFSLLANTTLRVAQNHLVPGDGSVLRRQINQVFFFKIILWKNVIQMPHQRFGATFMYFEPEVTTLQTKQSAMQRFILQIQTLICDTFKFLLEKQRP